MGRLEPGQSGPWWEKDSSKKPLPGGTDPQANKEWLSDRLSDDLVNEISVEAQMLYLARHASNREVRIEFDKIMLSSGSWDSDMRDGPNA